jgi:hypothetical protein
VAAIIQMPNILRKNVSNIKSILKIQMHQSA